MFIAMRRRRLRLRPGFIQLADTQQTELRLVRTAPCRLHPGGSVCQRYLMAGECHRVGPAKLKSQPAKVSETLLILTEYLLANRRYEDAPAQEQRKIVPSCKEQRQEGEAII